MPTGVVDGKRWKRDLNAHDPDARGQPPLWLVGEYTILHNGPAHHRTTFRRPIVLEDQPGDESRRIRIG